MEKEKERYFIEVAFKGTRFHGWQIQKNALSIQEVLDQALRTVFREEVFTLGCGRTDAGVHAKQLFAHFDLRAKRGIDVRKDLKSLNAILPSDIVAKGIFKVKPDAHARFDALFRSYEYHIHFEKNPFLTDFSYELRDKLDIEKMNEAAKIMMEYTDFSCFSKSNTQVFTNNCEITYAQWKWLEKGRLLFEIRANRFLRNMVRAIVGTLIEIGKGKQPVDFMSEVLKSKNRSVAGVSVPAHGLFLAQVSYPDYYFEEIR